MGHFENAQDQKEQEVSVFFMKGAFCEKQAIFKTLKSRFGYFVVCDPDGFTTAFCNCHTDRTPA